MKYRFSDLVDVARVQRLTDLFYEATGMVTAVIDLEGTILTGSGWRGLCTEFHRADPESRKRCVESDTVIANQIATGREYTMYECRNGLIDAATPIIVEGEHVANFFTGQFLLQPPDMEFFRSQARHFGFDEPAYMAAVEKIPVIDEARVRVFLDYFSEFAQMLGEMGMRHARQTEAESALRASEQRWATTLSSIGDAVIATDDTGGITFMNGVAEELTGWTFPEAEMKPIAEVFDIVNEQTRGAVESPVARVLREGAIVGLANHTILVRKDGTEVSIDDSGAPIRNRDGAITGAVLVFRDITGRKQAENEVLRAKEEWERTFASVPDSITIIDNEHRILRVNEAMARRLGKKTGECVGLRCYEAVHGLPEPPEFCPHSKTLKDGREHIEEVHEERLGGDFLVSTTPLRDENGRMLATVHVAHDITTRKKAEEALRRAHEELEQRVRERTAELQAAYEKLKKETAGREQLEAQLRQAQKMDALGTLSGGIAHDFNNILAAIIGFTELVAGHVTKGSRDERHLTRIMEASLRGRELVKQMLTFSRKMEQEKKPLRLSSIVRETTRLLRASIPTTISIRTSVKSESGVILADPSQIQQVLMNLCVNAADAMREKGGVLDVELSDFSVSASKAADLGVEPGLYMKLVVRDTGIGMSPDIVDRVFDPFFTTKKTGEGTGLGLSVVHGIVQQSNGYITAESEQGVGSTFCVYFPKTPEKPIAGTAGEDHPPTGDERILFVDDEEALVEMGEDILAELGYDVTSRMGGTEALALLKKDPGRFDLVITDQTMPDITGIELAREVLALRPGMPVIMCTGFSQLVDADTAKAAGIAAFVMKPLTRREIAKTIRQVLDQR